MIRLKVTGVDELVTKFNKIKTDVDLTPAITRLCIQYTALVKESYLSGRPYPNVVTGALRRSVTYKINKNGDEVVGQIGPRDLPYAAVLEFGFHGPVQVKAFDRTANNIFGRGISAQQHVNPFTRQMNMPAFHYMRDSLEQFRPTIIDTINKAINKAIK